MGGIVDRILKFVVGEAGVSRTTLLVWAIACLVMILAIGQQVDVRFKDSDDAMRVAEVRDLLGGQSWFDTTQYRVGPPAGLSMHWSRLVDLGVAGLYMAARPFADGAMAERFAMTVWPLLLLWPAMWAAAAIARHIAGNAAILPAAVLFFTGGAATNQFYPGRIHHHNAQLLAVLLLVLGAIRLKDGARFGVLAGLAAAFMLTIGIETILYLPIVCAYLALRLAFERHAVAPAVRAFGLSLAIATPGLAFLTLPASRIFAASCDMLSLPLLTSAVLAGIGFAALAGPLARLPRLGQRLGILAVFGAAVAATAFGMAPQCLQGPYAGLDPRLGHIYLDQINELRGLMDFFRDDPWRTLSIYHIALLAIPATIVAFLGLPAHRPALALLGVLFAVSLALAFVHIRYYTFFMAFPVPIVAAAVARISRWGTSRGASLSTGIAAGLMAAFLLPIAIAAPAASSPVEPAPAAQRGDCAEPASYSALAYLPDGLVVSPIDETPFILIASRQSVLASAYHRGGAGMLETYAMMTAPAVQARDLMRRRGIDYVVLCRGEKAGEFLAASAPTGLAHDLLAENVPDWLQSVPVGDTPMLVFRLR